MSVQQTTTNITSAVAQESLAQQLKLSLRGELLRPSDNGYEEARSVWNAMINRRPALIVRCLGVADVVTCVNAAREHNLTLCIKGGGHNISGLAVCDGGLMLDMSLMRGVWVDPTCACRVDNERARTIGDGKVGIRKQADIGEHNADELTAYQWSGELATQYLRGFADTRPALQ